MSPTFLDKIIESTRGRVASQRMSVDIDEIGSQAARTRESRPSNALLSALERKDRINIIAEFKRASPSKGVINSVVDVSTQVKLYEQSGACAISVLTEEHYFRGSIDDLREVRSTVELPILRKDFTIDEFQIYEAAAAGADAILLIVAALTSEDLRDFQRLAHVLGMDAIVEVHTADELEIASEIGARIIGVNNRNLRTFDVSLDVSRELIGYRPDGAMMITESGLTNQSQIGELSSLGFDGFLVGESLMRGDSLEVFTAIERGELR